MPLYTDPDGRFSLTIPETWTPEGDARWRPSIGTAAVSLYDHTSMSGDRTLAVDLSYQIRPNRHVFALEARRRSALRDGCPAERLAWTEGKADGQVWATVNHAIDLGDVCLDLNLFSQDGQVPAERELDAVAASFRRLRDPALSLSDEARKAYARRIAVMQARLADPSSRDRLDETIAEIADGLGRRALARAHEIAALTAAECVVKHSKLGALSFDPDNEDWHAILPLDGAPSPLRVLIYTDAQPSYEAEREGVLAEADDYAERILAVASRWTWASLTAEIAGHITDNFNENWRDEDDFPAPLTVAEIAGRLEHPSGLAMRSGGEPGEPGLTLYFKTADDLFGGHQVDAVMAADGGIAVCGMAG